MSITKPINWNWLTVLEHFFMSALWSSISSFILEQRRAGKKIYPADWDIFDCFNYCGPDRIKIVIVSDEPYCSKGQATGLAFSVRETNPKMYPPALKNLLRVVEASTKVKCTTGYLGSWAFQGVLFLNTTLTVEENKPESHTHLGWDVVCETVLNHLANTNLPIVYMLWGEKAIAKKHLIEHNPHQLVLETSHPKPATIHQGFAFCNHFKQANEFLKLMGRGEIDWRT